MNIEVKFSLKLEFKRVKDTLSKLDWYNSNSYKPRLPENINRQSSEEEIKNQTEKEFDEIKCNETKSKIEKDFLEIEKSLSNNLKEVFKKDIPNNFVVYLTSYGVYGSYKMPNIIILNINSKDIFKTIIHEIIHLIIEDKIQEYKIDQWEKERIVDLILNSNVFSFLNYNSWQKDYKNKEKYMDSLFHKYFFIDFEMFFKNIKIARESF